MSINKLVSLSLFPLSVSKYSEYLTILNLIQIISFQLTFSIIHNLHIISFLMNLSNVLTSDIDSGCYMDLL